LWAFSTSARVPRHDLAAFDGQRLRAWLLVVDGDDLATRIDRFGGVDLLLRRLRCLRWGLLRLAAPCQQASGEQRDGGYGER
jgi:hypothetical protein